MDLADKNFFNKATARFTAMSGPALEAIMNKDLMEYSENPLCK